jgi:hypothetical protein
MLRDRDQSTYFQSTYVGYPCSLPHDFVYPGRDSRTHSLGWMDSVKSSGMKRNACTRSEHLFATDVPSRSSGALKNQDIHCQRVDILARISGERVLATHLAESLSTSGRLSQDALRPSNIGSSSFIKAVSSVQIADTLYANS